MSDHDGKPRTIRTQAKCVSREVNDGWYYEDEQGLMLVIELVNPRRQIIAGVIPKRNVLAAAKRYEVKS